MNNDLLDILRSLSDAEADFLVVGAHAMAVHGYVRSTGDLDIWIAPNLENAHRVWTALAAFGAPLDDVSPEDLSTPDMVFQIGVAPGRVDILTSLSGIEFEPAWDGRVLVDLSGVNVPVLGKDDLIANKRHVGRMRDLADIEALEEAEERDL